MVISAGGLSALPPDADPQQLSMLAINPPTAALLLSEYVNLNPGEWVVQNAANSGVGRRVIAFAKTRGGADPDSGLFQRGAGLLAEPPIRDRVVRRWAFGIDRSQQLFRVSRGDSNRPFWLPVRRGALNGRRGAGGSTGDAVSRLSRPPLAWMV
jgi:hypothetical protein